MHPISKDTIYRILSSRYPSAQFVYLYGSVRRGTDTPSSDIDCIVITRDAVGPYREHFNEAGKVFDVYVFDPESLHAAMRQSYRAGEPMLVESVMSSEVLPASNTVSDRLMDIAREVRSIALRPPGKLILKIRENLASLLDDISTGVSGFERSMCMVELFTVISKSRLLVLGGGVQSFRYTARTLQAQNSAAASSLDSAFREAIAGDDTQLFELARGLLTDLGGPPPDARKKMLKEYTRMPI